jgi:hypothetical protein
VVQVLIRRWRVFRGFAGRICRIGGWRWGRKQRGKQEGLWIAQGELASAPGHPFYQRLNELLEAESFDEFVESRCAKFYAARTAGRQ